MAATPLKAPLVKGRVLMEFLQTLTPLVVTVVVPARCEARIDAVEQLTFARRFAAMRVST